MYKILFIVVIAACYICNTEAANEMCTTEAANETCNIWFGPAGYTNCVKFDDYSDYQWATCRTKVYIKRKSNYRHVCELSFATYCYYQCMIDVYDKEDGVVLPYCKCSPDGALPTESISLPAWCHSANGTSCTWYSECLSKAYPQCKDDDDEYAIQYAEKFCKLYDKNLKDFSSQGRNWVNAVRKCLQLKLVPVIDTIRDKNCAELKSVAFKTHTPCYLNPDSSSLSYCNLSIGDQLTVFWTIKSAFVDAFGPSLKYLYDVMKGCTNKFIETDKEKIEKIKNKIKNAVDRIIDSGVNKTTKILKETEARIETWLEDVVSPTNSSSPIQLNLLTSFDDLKRQRKRSIEDDAEIEKSRLAGKIIDAIALEKKWNDKGMAWFAYANNETEHDNTTMSIRFLVTDRLKYESVIKPANLSSILIELSEAVLKGTLNNLKVDGESTDIMALNGCIDWNCEKHAFNITFLESSNGAIKHGEMHTLSLACIILFVITHSHDTS